MGGSGFPANSVVSLGFDDGGSPFTTIPTTPDGTRSSSASRCRTHPHRPTCARCFEPGGVVADRAIEVLGSRDTTTPAVPGYGLGVDPGQPSSAPRHSMPPSSTATSQPVPDGLHGRLGEAASTIMSMVQERQRAGAGWNSLALFIAPRSHV